MVDDTRDQLPPFYSVAVPTLAATEAVAALVASAARRDEVIWLVGDLGAGKTSFARRFVRARCGDHDLEVPSPTFTLVQTYAGDGEMLTHADLYRLEDPSEAMELGLDDAEGQGPLLIEWPDRGGALTPPATLIVSFQKRGELTIILRGSIDWPARTSEWDKE